jgi:hypothetical protein
MLLLCLAPWPARLIGRKSKIKVPTLARNVDDKACLDNAMIPPDLRCLHGYLWAVGLRRMLILPSSSHLRPE